LEPSKNQRGKLSPDREGGGGSKRPVRCKTKPSPKIAQGKGERGGKVLEKKGSKERLLDIAFSGKQGDNVA